MPSEKEVFVALLQEHRAIIYKICRSYCDDKMAREDLAQEIVFNLWKSFHSYDTNFKFSTWMYRVALNVAISFYRREKKRPAFDTIDEALFIFEDSPADPDVEENIKLLQNFIGELNEIDRSIMILYLEDKSYKEVAAITGLRETNVATKIGRIKNKLKSNFETLKANQ